MPPKQTTIFHSFPVIQTKRRLLNRSRTIQDHSAPAPESKPMEIPVHAPPRSQSPPPSRQRHSSPAAIANRQATYLDGVVACIDVRTDDGDDVSLNFEKALQTMGAKTRRTFSDNVTHLIFKNGSATNLRKALQKKDCKIVSLLWITNCKSKGARLPEDGYLIEKPESLLSGSNRRRKSMEPGEVRALMYSEAEQLQQADAKRPSLPEKRSLLAQSYDSLPKRLKAPASIRSKSVPHPRRKTLPVSHWEKSAIIPPTNTNARSFAELDELDDDQPEEPMQSSTSSPCLPTSDQPTLPTAPSNVLSSFAKSMRRLSFRDKLLAHRSSKSIAKPAPLSSPSSYQAAAAAAASSKKKPTVNQSIKDSFYIPTDPPADLPSASRKPKRPSIPVRLTRDPPQ